MNSEQNTSESAKMVAIPVTLYQAVYNYLNTCPHGQVKHLVANMELTSQVVEIQTPKIADNGQNGN